MTPGAGPGETPNCLAVARFFAAVCALRARASRLSDSERLRGQSQGVFTSSLCRRARRITVTLSGMMIYIRHARELATKGRAELAALGAAAVRSLCAPPPACGGAALRRDRRADPPLGPRPRRQRAALRSASGGLVRAYTDYRNYGRGYRGGHTRTGFHTHILHISPPPDF